MNIVEEWRRISKQNAKLEARLTDALNQFEILKASELEAFRKRKWDDVKMYHKKLTSNQRRFDRIERDMKELLEQLQALSAATGWSTDNDYSKYECNFTDEDDFRSLFD